MAGGGVAREGRSVIALDTLAYARRLRQAGFTEQQAEAQADALAAVMVESLATKTDLQELDLRMQVRFARIDERFARIEERFARVDERFEHLERQMEARFGEQTARVEARFAQFEARFAEFEARFAGIDGRITAQGAHFDAKLADLERRLTVRLGGMMVAGIATVSALVKLL